MRHKQAVTYYVKSSEFCNFTDSLQNPQNNTYDITSKIHKKLHHFLTPCHVFSPDQSYYTIINTFLH